MRTIEEIKKMINDLVDQRNENEFYKKEADTEAGVHFFECEVKSDQDWIDALKWVLNESV